MTQQEKNSFLKPVRDFLLTYPELTPTQAIQIDYQEVRLSDRRGEGNALSFTNLLSTSDNTFVDGGRKIGKRANFELIMWRDTGDNEIDFDVVNFISDMIEFVNTAQLFRNMPNSNSKLPVFGNIPEKEVISATGGGRTATIPGTGGMLRNEYRFGIHCDFVTEYWNPNPLGWLY